MAIVAPVVVTFPSKRDAGDPYNQSVLKGDYPIRGNETSLSLSAVSTSLIEQRRAPTPSGQNSAIRLALNSWPAGTTRH